VEGGLHRQGGVNVECERKIPGDIKRAFGKGTRTGYLGKRGFARERGNAPSKGTEWQGKMNHIVKCWAKVLIDVNEGNHYS